MRGCSIVYQNGDREFYTDSPTIIQISIWCFARKIGKLRILTQHSVSVEFLLRKIWYYVSVIIAQYKTELPFRNCIGRNRSKLHKRRDFAQLQSRAEKKNTQKHAYGTSTSRKFTMSAFFPYITEYADHSAKQRKYQIIIIFIFISIAISSHVTWLLGVGFWRFEDGDVLCLPADTKELTAHTNSACNVTAQPEWCR